MQRLVTAELDLDLARPVDLVFQITAASSQALATEQLTFTQDDRERAATEIVDGSGTRLHRLRGQAGRVAVRYEALLGEPGAPRPTDELEAITYLRPSRYCQSDEVFAQARRQFGGLTGRELIAAVDDYVAGSTTYAPGRSRGTDSAVTTLATGHGVCRDYAHLVIALLRAMDVPARYAACFAPGLVPMDFHAVAEAYLDGAWYVIDATRLADRRSLVRIATGRDAADCAFLSYYGGQASLSRMHVNAVVVGGADADPPTSGHCTDDPAELIRLA